MPSAISLIVQNINCGSGNKRRDGLCALFYRPGGGKKTIEVSRIKIALEGWWGLLTSTGQCRRLGSTSPSRCRRPCRSDRLVAECRECWAGTCCRHHGSCMSHRPATRCSWTCTLLDGPPGTCSPLGWSFSDQRGSSTAKLNSTTVCSQYTWRDSDETSSFIHSLCQLLTAVMWGNRCEKC